MTMTTTTSRLPLTQRPAWKALAAHHAEVRGLHLTTLFAQDPGRGERLNLSAADLFLDYSKNRVTDQTLELLLNLAREADLAGRIEAMFRGDKINTTEGRSVMHVALRAPKGSVLKVDGQNVVIEVQEVLAKMTQFAERL